MGIKKKHESQKFEKNTKRHESDFNTPPFYTQKERWLQPIVDGRVRSSFAMTEPAPGSGSDPSAMLTVAEKKQDRWIVNGHKWFITGAGEAKHFILIARTSNDKRKGLTAFMFDAEQPGWDIVRRIPIMGPEEHGGHCEIRFEGLEIPHENVLMGEGDGLKVTQIRLGTARLTHCMRWTGMAKRALEETFEYVKNREVCRSVQLHSADPRASGPRNTASQQTDDNSQ